MRDWSRLKLANMPEKAQRGLQQFHSRCPRGRRIVRSTERQTFRIRGRSNQLDYSSNVFHSGRARKKHLKLINQRSRISCERVYLAVFFEEQNRLACERDPIIT